MTTRRQTRVPTNPRRKPAASRRAAGNRKRADLRPCRTGLATRHIRCIAFGLAFAWGCSFSAMAHPVHATFAEAVWNPKTRSIECALRVRGVDLEAALSKGLEKKVDLDKTEDIDALIGAYLERHFNVVTADGKTLKPRWSDKEVGLTNTWLYFDFPLAEGVVPQDCKLVDTVFFDDLDGQRNVVEFREGREKRILAFEGDVRELALAGEP